MVIIVFELRFSVRSCSAVKLIVGIKQKLRLAVGADIDGIVGLIPVGEVQNCQYIAVCALSPYCIYAPVSGIAVLPHEISGVIVIMEGGIFEIYFVKAV